MNIVFLGSTPNIGTTIISFGTALQLAKTTTHSVGYLCLNLKSSKIHRYLGIDQPSVTLDHLRAEMKSKSLRKERLLQYFHQVNKETPLYVLFGNMLREQAEYFNPEDIDYLLQVVKEIFDICIIEVNAYWDNAATICGLLQAKQKIIITSPELGHFQEDLNRWMKSLHQTFQLSISSFDAVVNYKQKPMLSNQISCRDLERETGMQVLGEVSEHVDVRHYLNQGQIMELLSSTHPINVEITGITDQIIQKHGLTKKEVNDAKRWYKKLFSKVSYS